MGILGRELTEARVSSSLKCNANVLQSGKTALDRAAVALLHQRGYASGPCATARRLSLEDATHSLVLLGLSPMWLTSYAERRILFLGIPRSYPDRRSVVGRRQRRARSSCLLEAVSRL